ncbi:MAG: putative toxin-antitoxin system toxin component, PIN family [Actinobacteria bacterium]|nr:putative toxin-antitoxin system toxin component, PIN family [Actinomycetota bacterium]
MLDVNVIISALLSPTVAPAKALREWQQGAFDLVVSAQLLEELSRALSYPKIRRRIDENEAGGIVELLRETAVLAPDPESDSIVRSPDPGDDYLIGLAEAEDAVLVSGDDHLLGLSGRIPVFSPREFIEEFLETG